MVRILLLADVWCDHYRFFIEAAQQRHCVLDFHTYQELAFSYQDNCESFLIAGKKVADYDIVFFRTVHGCREMQVNIAEFCRQQNIVVVDQVFAEAAPWIDCKSFEYNRLSSHGLPIIDSIFAYSQELWNDFNRQRARFPFPLVVKRTNGKQGDGVYKVNNEDELQKILQSQTSQTSSSWILQRYIPNHGDVRVLVVGNRVCAAHLRQSSNAQDFRNNITLGGHWQEYPLSTAMSKLARQAAHALHYDIAGIDFIYDSQEKSWKIMEVNIAPEFVEDYLSPAFLLPSENSPTTIHTIIIDYLLSLVAH